jgi:hypothetical protein
VRGSPQHLVGDAASVLFGGLAEHALADVLGAAQTKRYPRESRPATQDGCADSVHFLLSGALKFTATVGWRKNELKGMVRSTHDCLGEVGENGLADRRCNFAVTSVII